MNQRSHNKDDKKVVSMFKDLPPFSILVKDGEDAAWLSTALFFYLTGNDPDKANHGFELMCKAALEHGVEEGVNIFFESANSNNIRYPEFIKPIFIHMIDHAIKTCRKEEDE